jgi:D-amino-acid dehydrogenase
MYIAIPASLPLTLIPDSIGVHVMKVVVIGSGVIGVSTAYYLALAGMQVTVIDRQPAAAEETSFANAGQISPGYSTPWAAPGIPLKAMKWLFQKHAPLAIQPDGTLFQWRWLLHMLANCNARDYALNKSRMLRLATYSRDCLDTLRAQTAIAYEGRQQGTLQVFRTQAQLDAAQRDVTILRQAGIQHHLLDSKQLMEREPGLAYSQATLTGALWLPDDQTGDCHMFTRALAKLAGTLGVRFMYNTQLDSFIEVGKQVMGVVVSDAQGSQRLSASHVVLAAGSFSRPLAQRLALDLPVYPLKGYSLTLPLKIEHASRAPVSTVTDETYKVAITRFDERIRVGGMAELGGYDLGLNPRRKATLGMVLESLFPGVAELAQASFWTGLRPMTPDGTPIVGASGRPGLWLNTGHGTLGWTMACGSGKLLADLVAGKPGQIQSDDLALARYGSAGRLTSQTPALSAQAGA